MGQAVNKPLRLLRLRQQNAVNSDTDKLLINTAVDSSLSRDSYCDKGSHRDDFQADGHSCS